MNEAGSYDRSKTLRSFVSELRRVVRSAEENDLNTDKSPETDHESGSGSAPVHPRNQGPTTVSGHKDSTEHTQAHEEPLKASQIGSKTNRYVIWIVATLIIVIALVAIGIGVYKLLFSESTPEPQKPTASYARTQNSGQGNKHVSLNRRTNRDTTNDVRVNIPKVTLNEDEDERVHVQPSPR